MSLKTTPKQITDLPPIIGGPIVRRVEPNLVGIWVALKSAATIELTVWQGITDHEEVINGKPILQKVEQDTVQIGKHLHIAVVTLKLRNENTLQPESVYSYNMKFTWKEDDSVDDFQSLHLLDADPSDFNRTAISYEVDQLPSFVLPPRELEDLKILHGSCRNNANQYEDALAWVDDFINNDLTNAAGRPHQLFLSGDQIYADSVLGNLLHNLTEWGNILLDNKETLPTEWPDGNENRFQAITRNFPSFYRHRLVDSEARLTGSKSNHLLSFGEFAGMYLSVWSDILWDVDNLPTFEEVFNLVNEVPDSYGAIFRRNLTDERKNITPVFDDQLMNDTLQFLFETLTDKAKLKTILTEEETTGNFNQGFAELNQFKDTLGERLEEFEVFFEYLKELLGGLYGKKEVEIEKEDGTKVKTYEKYVTYDNRAKTLHRTLPKVRRALANISTYMMFDDHEISDDWNLNPAWRDRVHSSPLGRAVIRNGLMSYALFQDWGNRPEEYIKQGYLIEFNTSLESELENIQLTDTLKNAFAAEGITLNQEKVTINKLADGEWLLEDSGSKDSFIIRKYEEPDGSEVLKVLGNPHAYLLSQIAELFKPENTGPNVATENTIDWLLGIDHHHRIEVTFSGRYELPKNRSPLIKWHYTAKGPKHKVLVIDNRTRRSFVSFAGAPGNLDVNGMNDLIPSNPSPKEDEVLFVVAPLPVLGPSVLDELIAPLAYKSFDFIGSLTGNENVKSGMKGTNPDAIEAWSFDPESLEELLKRLAPFRKIVFLSGDVHYASSQGMCYWKKDDDQPSCFAQLTSSGLRNVMPSYIQIAAQRLPTASKVVRQNLKAERMGWNSNDPAPLTFPDESKVSAFLKHKLRKSPVLISTYGWPEGTNTAEPPDWSWRVKNILDLRSEEDRPELTRLESLPEGTVDKTIDALRAIATRHIDQAKKVNYTRQILFKSNIGMVGFEKDVAENILYVTHQLHAVPFEADPDTPLEIRDPDEQRQVYCLHKIPLDGPNEEKPKF